MSFLSPKAPAYTPPPRPTPPAPRIGDAPQEAAVREESARVRKRRGTDETILTSLGSPGAQASTRGATLLGSGTRY